MNKKLAMAALIGLSGMSFHNMMNESREPTVPTEEELQWMVSLNSYRKTEWRRRFSRGLTVEQREYINEILKGKS